MRRLFDPNLCTACKTKAGLRRLRGGGLIPPPATRDFKDVPSDRLKKDKKDKEFDCIISIHESYSLAFGLFGYMVIE